MRSADRNRSERTRPVLNLALFALLFQVCFPLLHELQHDLARDRGETVHAGCHHAHGVVAARPVSTQRDRATDPTGRLAEADELESCALCAQLRLGPREVPCPEPPALVHAAVAIRVQLPPQAGPEPHRRCEPWCPRAPPSV